MASRATHNTLLREPAEPDGGQSLRPGGFSLDADDAEQQRSNSPGVGALGAALTFRLSRGAHSAAGRGLRGRLHHSATYAPEAAERGPGRRRPLWEHGRWNPLPPKCRPKFAFLGPLTFSLSHSNTLSFHDFIYIFRFVCFIYLYLKRYLGVCI